jgi:hypothetical protein
MCWVAVIVELSISRYVVLLSVMDQSLRSSGRRTVCATLLFTKKCAM